MKKRIFMILLISLFLISCSSLTKDEQNNERQIIDKMASDTIAKLVEDDPTIEKELEEAVGYAVIDMKLTKVPMFGAGGGNGVLVNLKDKTSKYYKVRRVDFGAGWGARIYKVLVIINDEKVLKEYENGKWIFEFGSEASVGKIAAEGSSSDFKPKIKSYILTNGGVSATITIRVIRVKNYRKLNKKMP